MHTFGIEIHDQTQRLSDVLIPGSTDCTAATFVPALHGYIIAIAVGVYSTFNLHGLPAQGAPQQIAVLCILMKDEQFQMVLSILSSTAHIQHAMIGIKSKPGPRLPDQRHCCLA